jgi:hypothetical protein
MTSQTGAMKQLAKMSSSQGGSGKTIQAIGYTLQNPQQPKFVTQNQIQPNSN